MPATESPDIRQLQNNDLPTADFPAGTRHDFRVYFTPAVHEQIWKHASADVAVEICGVLVGLWQHDTRGPFVAISEFIRCDSAKSGFAEVTFTHESWTKINAEMDTRLAGFKIVGWYHSHPDFGIFLSDRDIFIHQHFFSGAGQIAHVVDPVRKFEGVFAWHEGKPVLRPHFWVGERIVVTPERPAGEDGPRALRAEPVAGALVGTPAQPGWLAMLTSGLIYFCVFLVGYLLAGRPAEWVRQRERQRDLVGLIAYFTTLGVLRPGLEDELTKLGDDLHAVTSDVKRLGDRNVKLASDDKVKTAVKEQWDEVGARLTGMENRLERVQREYSLTPDEQAVFKGVMRELNELAERSRLAERKLFGSEEKPGLSHESSKNATKRKREEGAGDSKQKSAPPVTKSGGDSTKASEKRKPSKE